MPKKRGHGDGALYPIRGGKLYRGVVDRGVDPTTGRRVQSFVHARTKSECKRRLDDLKDEIAKHGAPLNKRVTVETWAEKWLASFAKGDVDPKTFSGYRGMIRNWITPAIGTKSVVSLRPSDAVAVRNRIEAAGRGRSTALQAHVVLSLLLDAAVAERLCEENVMKHVARPGSRENKDKVVTSSRGALTTEQVTAILQASSRQPLSAGSRWWFKMLSGQRQGEILGARLADLDLERGVYTVNWKLEELTREHGCEGDEPPSHPRGHVWACGKKNGAACPAGRWSVPREFDKEHLFGAWHFTPPKSQRGRQVPLIPQLAEAIGRHLDATRDWPNPHGLVWRGEDGRPILPKVDNQEWRDLLQAAGVITAAQNAPKVNPYTGHWTRHTVVTVLAALGADREVVREIIGHASEDVSALYRHVQETERRAVMDQLAGAWAGALEGPKA